MRASTLLLMLVGTTLSGCATMQAERSKPMPTLPAAAPALAPAPVARRPIVVASTPVPNPPERPARRPAVGAVRRAPESGDPAARVARANAAARVQPTGRAYANAAQIYPYAEGALFQVYTAPGRITDITLEEGETLSGTGPVAAGDTVRWIIGDTESGSGPSRRVHILVKPTRADLQTNLVINTNRRTYHLELRATPATYMASVAWRYPADEALAAAASVERYAAPTVAIEQLNFNYKIFGDRPSWRPVRVFDDGRQTFIEFAPSVTQGELPPLFVGGADGKAADLVNYRVSGQRMVVDRLFTRAELRLGDRRGQKRVRIERGAGGMTMSTTSQAPAREAAEELRLRSARPRVARLSRKVLIAFAATSSLAVVGAVAYAMTTHAGASAPAEVYNVGGQPPERLNALPRDYGAAPRLGPPLPGDLGRPMLEAEVAPPPMAPVADADAAQQEAQARRQRLLHERDAARTSRLFSTDARGQDASVAEGAVGQMEAATSAPAGRRTILDGPVDRRTTSPDRLASPASPFVLQAGATIPAALLTGVRSDLPGQIVGQVTENVYDSVSGRFLLIPQGSKLIGAYDTQVAFGQSRVLLAWTRLILPNGRSLVLEKLPAGDAQGYAGLQDRVDRHWGALFGAAALSTILGIGAELGEGGDENDILRALRHGAAGSFNQVGQQAVGRSLNIPPTLTIRPGAPVRVMVTRDLVLEPYRG